MRQPRSFFGSLLVIATLACSSTTVTQSEDAQGGQTSGGYTPSSAPVRTGGSKSSSGGTKNAETRLSSSTGTTSGSTWVSGGGTRATSSAIVTDTSVGTGKTVGGTTAGGTTAASGSGGTPSGSAGMGGTLASGGTSGGVANAGTSTTAAKPAGGSGITTGGVASSTRLQTGGIASGGAGGGGRATGGVLTGGTATGGAATGGAATGGATTGGVGTGGAATGGTATGGVGTGGRATGGATTGGVANCVLTVTSFLVDAATATLSANGSACEPSCSLSLPCGTAVTLTPKPNATTGFSGWDDPSGACLGTTSPCVFNLTANTSIKGTFHPYNRAFISSTSTSSKLGGLTNADATCRSLATSAGLPGASKYVAFLSTDSVDAIERLGSARGWLRTDGMPFADSVRSIQSGTLWYPLVLTESGTTSKLDGEVFTGSLPDGSDDLGYDCNGWTDATAAYNARGGLIGGGSALWLTWATGNCTQIPSAPIYCFGTAYSVPLAAPGPNSGRRVFASASKFVPAAGKTIKDADDLCVSDATKYGICSSSSSCAFKAVLAQSGASAKSHFTNQDGSTPIVRLDGVKVASSSSYFWRGTLTAPVSLHANGAYSTQGERVFTGAATPSTAGTSDSTCKNWSDVAVTTGVNYGVPATGPIAFNWTTLWGCNESNPIYCLEDVP